MGRIALWCVGLFLMAGGMATTAQAQLSTPTGLDVRYTHLDNQFSQFVWFWNDTSAGEAGFSISYRIVGQSTVFTELVPDVPANNSAYTSAYDAIAVDTTIQFHVRAFTGSGASRVFSAPSTVVSLKIPPKTFNPPTNIVGTPLSESSLRVSWTEQSTSEDGVEVWGRAHGNTYGTEPLIDIMFYQSQSLDIPDLEPSRPYYFKLRPFRIGANNVRTYSNPEFSAESPGLFTAPPDAPTNLRVDSYGGDFVVLKWKDNSTGESHYDIMSRPVGGGPFLIRQYYSLASNPEGNDMGTTISGLAPGVAHEFVVRARSEWVLGFPPVFSTLSNVATQVLRDAITSPHYVQGHVGQPFSYTLTTTTNTGAPTGRSITNLPPGLTFDNNTGVISGTPTTAGVTEASMSVVWVDAWQETQSLAIRILEPPVAGATIPGQNLVTGTPSAPVALSDKFTDPSASSAVRVSTTLGDMDFVMFDADTPLTVANFHHYRTANEYTNNVFHRSVSDFVIQAGGYRIGNAENHFFEVNKIDDVDNEFQHSNIRGTVAMAKLGPESTHPDPQNSATSEWFINLENNGPNLDNQNGGFTAFARVAGNGMAVADAIARKPTNHYFVLLDADTQFSELRDFPLNANEALVHMDNTKAMRINSVTPVGLFTYDFHSEDEGVATADIEDGQLFVTPVDSGTTNITVTATNLDGKTVSQTFQVNVISNVATLSNLVPSSGTLSPAFVSGTTSYTVAVPNSVSSLALTPTSTSQMATITVEGAPVNSGAQSTFFPLPVGDTVLDVEILAEDGVSTEHYTVTVKRSAVGLASTFLSVNEEAGFVNIPLVRSNDFTDAVTIQLSTNNGGAVAPDDFTPKTNEQVTLGANQFSLNVPITIFNPPNPAEGNESFTVTISNVPSGTALAAPETVTVLIIDSVDAANPSVAVSAPTEGLVHKLNSGTPVSIVGTAADNRGVKQVQMSVNGGPFTDIAFNPPAATSPTNVNFNLPISPISGTNTVSLRSIDYRNRTSATVVRTFKVLRPLSVTHDSSLGSLTAGYAGSTFREVGRSFTIAATPKPFTTTPDFQGAIFTGWTIGGQDVVNGNIPFTPARLGITASALEKQSLTFIFREGLMLTANFIPNPFPDMAGNYHGLIRPSSLLPDRAPTGPGVEDGTKRTNASEGFIKATVTNMGGFSGTLTIDGLSLLVSGAFDQNGNARFGSARLKTQTVARTGKPSLVVAFQLDMNTPGSFDKISGTVTATEFKQSVIVSVSTVEADRAYYNGTTLIPTDYLAPANANGKFTTIFPAEPEGTQTPGYDIQDYPQGRGVATVTIAKTGVVTVAGVLADGSALSATSALSESRNFPLFAQLYNKLGFLSGFVQLDHTQADSDLAAQDLEWLRPFQGTSHYYPNGWTNPIKVDILGARYTVTAGQSVVKAANGANLPAADADGNVALSFTGGLLTEPLHRAANLSTTDGVIKVPDNDPTFTMGVNRNTGAVTGVFDHTDDTKPAYNAIVIQKGPNAGVFGYFLTKQPVPIDYTGESGGVSIMAQP